VICVGDLRKTNPYIGASERRNSAEDLFRAMQVHGLMADDARGGPLSHAILGTNPLDLPFQTPPQADVLESLRSGRTARRKETGQGVHLIGRSDLYSDSI
jgi:hypothetical protein